MSTRNKITILRTYQKLFDEGKLGKIGLARFKELLQKYNHYPKIRKENFYAG